MKKMTNSSFRLIKALRRQALDRPPIWFMRQAGRYLPEYRKVREKAGDFLSMCKNPHLACEVTLQPIQRFSLDAAIIFSDILTIPDAMGLGLHFNEDGPQFQYPAQSESLIESLIIPQPEQELAYVMQAIRLVAKECHKVPLIGFCGSPWTVATYMVEGKSSRTFSIIKAMMYQSPELLCKLLDKLTQASCLYLAAQVAAGANAVMVFDTWGGILSTPCFQKFSLHFMQQIVQYIKAHTSVPIILFTKQGGQWLELLAASGCDALGIDWTVDMKQARERVGHQVALQGNLDPAVLYASPQVIKQEVNKLLATFGERGHIFNLGHGIAPDISPESVQTVIEAVHEFK